MELPKFVLADNTDFPDDIFIIHLDFPRFIINIETEDIEFFDEIDEGEEAEIEAEMEVLLEKVTEFYKREINRYEEDED